MSVESATVIKNATGPKTTKTTDQTTTGWHSSELVGSSGWGNDAFTKVDLSDNSSESKEEKKQLKKDCLNWMKKGKCNKGQKCAFLHRNELKNSKKKQSSEENNNKQKNANQGKSTDEKKKTAQTKVPVRGSEVNKNNAQTKEEEVKIEQSNDKKPVPQKQTDKTKTKKFVDIKSFFKTRKINVPNVKKMSTIVELNNLSERVYMNNTMDVNPHCISAMYREYAMQYILKKLGTGVVSLKIHDWYGSPRNKNFSNDLQNTNLTLDFIRTKDHTIQGDNARGMNDRKNSAETLCDFVLIEDVYENGLEGITPQRLISLANGTRLGKVIVIKRNFIGHLGVDSEDYNEGCWFRDENGLINFSPSPQETCYPPHADLSWITDNRSYHGLDISEMTVCGPYHIYECSPTTLGAIALPKGLKQTGYFEVLEYRIPYNIGGWRIPVMDLLYKYVSKNIPIKTVSRTVHMPTFSKSNLQMQIKSLRGTLYDHVRTIVSAEFERDRICRVLAERFRPVMNEILQNTVEAIIFSGRLETIDRLALTNVLNIQKEADLEVARLAVRPELNPTESSWFKTIFLNAIIPAIALVLIKKGTQKLFSYFGSINWTQVIKPQSIFDFTIPSPIRSFIQLLHNILLIVAKIFKPMLLPLIFLFRIIRKQLIDLFGRTLPQTVETIEAVQESREAMYDVYKRTNKLLFWCKTKALEGVSYCLSFMPTTNIKRACSDIVGTAIEQDKVNRVRSAFFLNCFAAPCYEEIVRTYCLPFSVFLNGYEAWIKRRDIQGCFTTVLFHGVMTLASLVGIDFQTRAGLHMLWNVTASVLGYHKYWMSFVGAQCLDVIEKSQKTLSFVEPNEIPEGVYTLPAKAILKDSNMLPPSKYHLTPAAMSSLVVKYNGYHVPQEDFVEFGRALYEQSQVKDGLWLIMTPQIVFARPANSPINWWAIHMTRIFKNPFDEEESQYMYHLYLKDWAELTKVFMNGLWEMYAEHKYTLEDVRKIVGKKAQRLVDAVERNNKNGNKIEFTKAASVKSDETLPFKSEYPHLRPRAITQYSPKLLGELCPIARELTDIMHDLFCPQNIFFVYNSYLDANIPCTFTFGSGYTAEQLDSWFEEALMRSDTIHFIVAGDDMAVIWGTFSRFYGPCGENDMTSYEFTQREGQFRLYEAFLRFYIKDLQWIKDVLDAFKQEYKSVLGESLGKKNKDRTVIRIKGKVNKIVMASGHPLTTLLNSLGNIGFCYNLVRKTDFQTPVERLGKDMGFICKYKECQYYSQMTFLKGWWQVDLRGRYRWVPLPGMVLKFGKTKRDPTVIAKNKDYKAAMRICSYAIAASLGYIPHNYPILGPWLLAMKRMGTLSNIKIYERYERTVRSLESIYNLDREEAIVSVIERYNITRRQILEVEELIDSIIEIPACISHEAFRALLRDYL